MAPYLGNLAYVYTRLGMNAEAKSRLDLAFATMEGTGEVWIEPELLRLRAAVELALHPKADAGELTLWTALEKARVLGAAGFELRVLCDLAEQLIPQHRHLEIRDRIEHALGALQEGFQTLDVRRARGLLQQCAA